MLTRRMFAVALGALGLTACAGCTDGARAAGTGSSTGSAAVRSRERAATGSSSVDVEATHEADASAAEGTAAMTVTGDTLIYDVIGNPLFAGYGRLLFPVTFDPPTADMTLADLPQYLPWYSEIRAETTVDVVNDLLARRASGETIFYDIYAAEEKAADPSLEDTGLFHVRPAGLATGERAPFAVWCAGGGFAYVASMHDSFPHALALSRAGYHGFAIQYRPDAQLACEDLARALSFIFAHADELGVDTAGYALGGGSAGARMAAYVGGYGAAAFGGDAGVPRPAAVIMQYTGHCELSGADPATYACVGDRDGIASWRTMRSRLDALASMGIATEFHVYPGLRHGFGLGIGTVAEGWIDDAVAFWQAQR